jgi:hypothetical protein
VSITSDRRVPEVRFYPHTQRYCPKRPYKMSLFSLEYAAGPEFLAEVRALRLCRGGASSPFASGWSTVDDYNLSVAEECD